MDVKQKTSTGAIGFTTQQRDRIAEALREATLCADTQKLLRGVLMSAQVADVNESDIRACIKDMSANRSGYSQGVTDALLWILGEGRRP